MIKTKKQKSNLFTPLRYPGGKTSLYEYFSDVIEKHGWENITYIEPYAGGAGAALSLLILGKVKKVVINDYDPAIYAFWYSVTNSSEDFIELIDSTPVTIDEWRRQKQIYKNVDQSNLLQLGFATFFLNRTNRSGILNAGPIGGMGQLGEWKLDARYNKANLIAKIKLIALHKDSITVLNLDGLKVIKKYAAKKNSFLYVDPPYYVKGGNLYLNAFNHADHEKLAQVLKHYSASKWLLSYDNEDAIRRLYVDFNYEIFSLKYSAHHNTKIGSELMIFSEQIRPEDA